ncbi:MAG: Bro-N domain-containing protein [Saprospiraceae bacterium]|nr:Bro-N domain-containing protein [Saprospiraceae bacterium]
MKNENALTPFEGKEIRKIWHDDEWYFSVVDVIEVLSESSNPSNYWNMLKKRDAQLYTVCVKLKLMGKDGKARPSDCAHTEGVLRIVMSVPSPKAEPLKLWLAQVGKERIAETENPEISVERLTELYRAKGYDDIWIGNRLKTIGIRKELTDEWKKRGVKEQPEYAILTAEIAKATFGLTPSEHAKLKGLDKQNLRDNMTNMELIFTALSEEITRSETVKNDAQGFHENREMAIKGGTLAGKARKLIEDERGEKVVSAANFLDFGEDKNKEIGLDTDKKSDF